METGSIVQLKSGGPLMTVNEVINSKSVRCCWFIGNELYSHIFLLGVLSIRVDDERNQLNQSTEEDSESDLDFDGPPTFEDWLEEEFGDDAETVRWNLD